MSELAQFDSALQNAALSLSEPAVEPGGQFLARKLASGVRGFWPQKLNQWTPDEPLRLVSGAPLEHATIGYQTWGTINAEGSNAIWVCHALTGNTDVESWWSGIFGAGKALDPERYFIVCANVLGGCYGSAGPASHGPDFPEIQITDMVQQQRLLADHLGIRQIALMLGGSMGGFQALTWAHLDTRVRKLALVATSFRQPPQAVALADLQCQAIRLDPRFQNGHYAPENGPVQGLALARKIGHLSYRCETELNSRFAREKRADGRLQVLSYLDHQGDKLVQRFDANSYLRITEAMNRFELSREQLERLTLPSLIVSVQSDWLYQPAEQEVLAERLPKVKWVRVESDFGHDGFLINAADFEADLRAWLD